MKVKHVISKTKKPIFEVILGKATKNQTNKNDILNEISENNVIDFIKEIFDNSKTEIDEIKVFYDPSVEVKVV